MNKNNINYIKAISMVVSGLFFICLTSCGETIDDEHTEVHEEEIKEVQFSKSQCESSQIEIGDIEKRTLSNSLQVTGMIDAPPQNLISISAPMGGFVASTDLIDGMKVRKGQKLVTIENQDFIQLQQDYLDKKSQLDYLEKEYQRQQKLRDENVNSEKTAQQVTSQYKSMKAQLNGLRERLAYIGISTKSLTDESISRKVTIFSPVNGFVSKINMNIGKFCMPSDVLLEVVNTDHLHAELTVFEKDISKLKVNQKVKLEIPGFSKMTVKAEIYIIGKLIGEDRTVKVHAHFDEESDLLAPGMYVTGIIELDENKTDALPEEAVLSYNKKFYIAIFEKEDKTNPEKRFHFKLLEVEKGITENGYTEVIFLNGLQPDKLKIVKKGAYSILAAIMNGEESGGHAH